MKLAILWIMTWSYGTTTTEIVPADVCNVLAEQAKKSPQIKFAECFYYSPKLDKSKENRNNGY